MTLMNESELLRRKLEREQRARCAAETLLEAKSRELFEANEKLRHLNTILEQRVRERTAELEEAKEVAKELGYKVE